MDSRYLKSLIAVVDTGSIAEAARSEGLTAAAISQRIQALEREIGVTLLSRAAHSARATAACLSLLPRARAIVQDVSLLAGDTDASGLTGSLRIGMISTALTGLLPAMLQTMTRAAPGITPAILPGTSRDLYRLLLQKELDAAILVAPPFDLPKDLHSASLRREPLVFLSAKATRTAMSTTVPTPLPPNAKTSAKPFPGTHRRSLDDVVAELHRSPYVRYDPNAWGGRHATRFLNQHEVAPSILCDLDALEAIALLVSDRVGVSLVPAWPGLERMTEACDVSPISDPAYAREVVLVHAAQSDRPAMLRVLIDAAMAAART